MIFSPLSSHVSPSLPVELLLCLPHPLQVADPEFPESVVCDATTTDPRFTAVRKFEFGNQSPAGLAKYKFMAMELVGGNTSNKVRARWVALRARWGTLRAHWGTLRARWVTFINRLGEATSLCPFARRYCQTVVRPSLWLFHCRVAPTPTGSACRETGVLLPPSHPPTTPYRIHSVRHIHRPSLGHLGGTRERRRG